MRKLDRNSYNDGAGACENDAIACIINNILIAADELTRTTLFMLFLGKMFRFNVSFAQLVLRVKLHNKATAIFRW